MTTEKTVAQRLRRLIIETFDVEPEEITLESKLVDDLGADSLMLVELVLAVEEEFEIDVPDEDTEKIYTVQDALTYLEQHVKG